MAMKIAELQIENVKRVKAVKLEPSENGLTIIGGDNAQGRRQCLTQSSGRWAETSISHPKRRTTIRFCRLSFTWS